MQNNGLPKMLLTFNKLTARRFAKKMGLLKNNKELQFKTCGLMVNYPPVQRNQGRKVLL